MKSCNHFKRLQPFYKKKDRVIIRTNEYEFNVSSETRYIGSIRHT
jgi:hypothetical protein